MGAAESGETRRPQRSRVAHRLGTRSNGRQRYYTWAELWRRVCRGDVLTCPRCSGVRRRLAASQDPDPLERVLRAMGLLWAVIGARDHAL